MRIKLDENLGRRGGDLLQAAGHDVLTVVAQDMCSASDSVLITACSEEGRCLVTLDLDFANPLMFKPADHAGIAVLRLPSKPTGDDLLDALRTFVAGAARTGISGKLWIVQRGRIREYDPERENSA